MMVFDENIKYAARGSISEYGSDITKLGVIGGDGLVKTRFNEVR